MSEQIHFYSMPTKIAHGPGARNEIPKILKDLGSQKVLIVSDQGVAQLPWFSEFPKICQHAGCDALPFTDVAGNPTHAQFRTGLAKMKSFGADTILAVGGGAALDVAKAIALMTHHPGDLFDYDVSLTSTRPVNQPTPPILAVPTTAGTGSEVGRSLAIADDQTHEKKMIFGASLLPKFVALDPELLVGLPPALTAATGMDALTHLVEAFLSKEYHPICEGIALEGIRLVNRSLVASVKNGSDLLSRNQMLLASSMGAIAFQKELGVTHSCAHALSAVYDTHHGLANGILIPYAMKYNASAVPEKMDRLARVVEADNDFIDWLENLKNEIGIPKDLRKIGASKKELPRLVDLAAKDICNQFNPREVSKEGLHEIFKEAME